MIIGSDMNKIGKKHDPDGMIRVAVEAIRMMIMKASK
jgi:hypothetical protein